MAPFKQALRVFPRNPASSSAFIEPLQSRSFSSSSSRARETQDAYIISAARTPVGVFGGGLASLPAPQLAKFAIKGALSRTNLPAEAITSAYMGNVLSGGMGQAPARQAVLASGFSSSVEATTVNKVCSSGLKSVVLAAQQIELGLEAAVLAGGMESMSQVPYYVPRGPQFPAFGHVSMRDGLIADGLWDPHNNVHMGNCAENTVKKYKISREAQDAYAIESYRRAGEAWKAGHFAAEVAPVTIKGKKGDTVVDKDEGYTRLKADKVPTLKPAFVRDGTGSVTAANSSGLSDGASALILTNADLAREHAKGSRVLARLVASADAAMDPIDFPIAPAKAVPLALKRAGLEAKDIAAWEINEAFAAVVIANTQILGLDGDKDMEKVNAWGGAISLGHAIGSSGARILTTLLHQLKVGEFGVAAICNGGGAASVVVVQRVDHV